MTYFRFLKMKLKQKQTMAKVILMDINMEPYTVTQVMRILMTLMGVPSGGIPSVKCIVTAVHSTFIVLFITWPYGGFILPQSNYRLDVNAHHSNWYLT